MADYGIQIEPNGLGYVQLTSDRMLIEPVVVAAARRAFAADRPQEVFTYLANRIKSGGREIPYSTITAIDFSAEAPLGPFTTPEGRSIEPLADDEIALNTWAAERPGAEPGDELEIIHFVPASTHGHVREAEAQFRLKCVGCLAVSGAGRG